MLSGGRLVWSALVVLPLAVAAGCGKSPPGPRGTGEATTSTIGAAGGTVEHPEGAAVTVPAGALTADEAITITSLAEDPPGVREWSSPLFRLEPDGLVFAAPVTLSIGFTGHPDRPVVFRVTEPDGVLEDLGGMVDDAVFVELDHFSEYFVAPSGAVIDEHEDCVCEPACGAGEACTSDHGECVCQEECSERCDPVCGPTEDCLPDGAGGCACMAE